MYNTLIFNFFEKFIFNLLLAKESSFGTLSFFYLHLELQMHFYRQFRSISCFDRSLYFDPCRCTKNSFLDYSKQVSCPSSLKYKWLFNLNLGQHKIIEVKLLNSIISYGIWNSFLFITTHQLSTHILYVVFKLHF